MSPLGYCEDPRSVGVSVFNARLGGPNDLDETCLALLGRECDAMNDEIRIVTCIISFKQKNREYFHR